MQTVDSRATQTQFHGKLDINNCKMKILKTPFKILFKLDKNICTVVLQNVSQLWWNRPIANPWEFSPW